MRNLARNRLAGWIALGAILYAAASPLLAALRFQGAPEVLAQICSLGGVKQAPAQEPSAPSHEDTRSLKHCVFCLNGAWQPPADEALADVSPAAPAARAGTRLDEVPPPDLSALQPLNPRAPPHL
jgi:hypothetical protein